MYEHARTLATLMRALLSLGLGLDLGKSSLGWRGVSTRVLIHGLQSFRKKSGQLILNDTRQNSI